MLSIRSPSSHPKRSWLETWAHPKTNKEPSWKEAQTTKPKTTVAWVVCFFCWVFERFSKLLLELLVEFVDWASFGCTMFNQLRLRWARGLLFDFIAWTYFRYGCLNFFSELLLSPLRHIALTQCPLGCTSFGMPLGWQIDRGTMGGWGCCMKISSTTKGTGAPAGAPSQYRP